jgi:hypothetical protein
MVKGTNQEEADVADDDQEGRACLRDAMMYMFCLRAHRFIYIIFFWPMFLSKKYQSPRGITFSFFQKP